MKGLRIFICTIGLVAGLMFPQTVKADCSHMIDSGETYKVKATSYCLKGTMANGEKVHAGCVAYAPETIGKTMIMWNADTGEYMGTYEITDTGSKNIRAGYVVDVWLPTYDEAIQFGSKNVLIQIVDAKG